MERTKKRKNLITTNINNSLYEKIKQICEEQDYSIAEFTRMALREAIIQELTKRRRVRGD